MTWNPDHSFVIADADAPAAGGDVDPVTDPTPCHRPRLTARERFTHDRAHRPDHTSNLTRRHFLQGSAMAGVRDLPRGLRHARHGRQRGTRLAPVRRPAASGGAGGTELRFANWIGYIDTADDGSYPTLREVHRRDRDRGDLPRGHQRQRGVLRGEPRRPARCRPPDRLGHRRPDRLDDRPARPPRLAGRDRQGQHAELRREPGAVVRRSHVRPGHEVRRAVAVRHDRPRASTRP